MRQPITMRLDPRVIEAAKQRAVLENRTLTNFIETVLCRELGLAGLETSAEVLAPPNIRDYLPLPEEGETQEQRAQREDLLNRVLGESGH